MKRRSWRDIGADGGEVMGRDAFQFAGEIKAKAKEIGFDLVGIAPAEPSKYRDYFRQWLDDGQAGSMQYLANRFEERTDPASYLPGAKSVICGAINYYTELAEPSEGGRNKARAGGAVCVGGGLS